MSAAVCPVGFCANPPVAEPWISGTGEALTLCARHRAHFNRLRAAASGKTMPEMDKGYAAFTFVPEDTFEVTEEAAPVIYLGPAPDA